MERRDRDRPDDLPDRLLHVVRRGRRDRGTGARAGGGAGRRQRDAGRRAALHPGAARRHPRRARRGGDRPRRARPDGLRQRGGGARCSGARPPRTVLAAEPRRARRALRDHQGGRLAGRGSRTCRAGGWWRASTRRRCSPAASTATPVEAYLAADQGDALHRRDRARACAVNIIEDVTEAKDAELRQRFLAEAGQLLASSLDYEQTLRARGALVVPWLADWCARRPARRARRDRSRSRSPTSTRRRSRWPQDLRRATRRTRTRRPACPAILRGGPAELYREIPDELLEQAIERPGAARGDPRDRHALGDGRADADRRQTLGAHHARHRRQRPARSTRTTSPSPRTSRCAPRPRSRTRACTQAQERVAHTLQASLLPERLPELPGWEARRGLPGGRAGRGRRRRLLRHRCPSTAAAISSFLGDVTGKGIEAAALTSLVRHSVRTAARFDPRPARVLSLVNEILREQPRLSLVTLVCALVETDGAGDRHGRLGRPSARRCSAAPGRRPAPLGDHGVLLGGRRRGRLDGDRRGARARATRCCSTPTA